MRRESPVVARELVFRVLGAGETAAELSVCRRLSSSTGRTSGKQSRCWKKPLIAVRMRFLLAAFSLTPGISCRALSRYSLDEMVLPCSLTSWSEKSRTTHKNLGKNCAKAVPSSSFDVLVRMYFVISTTSESVSMALSLMVPTLL